MLANRPNKPVVATVTNELELKKPVGMRKVMIGADNENIKIERKIKEIKDEIVIQQTKEIVIQHDVDMDIT